MNPQALDTISDFLLKKMPLPSTKLEDQWVYFWGLAQVGPQHPKRISEIIKKREEVQRAIRFMHKRGVIDYIDKFAKTGKLISRTWFQTLYFGQ